MGAKFRNQQWLHHDRTRKPVFRERVPVTVCVGTLFQWNIAPPGQAEIWVTSGIVASDRMLTAGDVQYEPAKLKMAQMTPLVIAVVAGDYPLHSQTIIDARKLIQNNPDKTPENVARMYGKAIQRIKQREAEDLYLVPLGMNTDTFIAQQKEMSDNFIEHITTQLQGYQGEEVEALVIGSDGERVHLYAVDTRGIAHCMDDVGFAAIGIGAWHAKSRMMQAGYANTSILAPALAITYAAKKSAEIAPGVGKQHTDIMLILRDAVFPLWDDVAGSLRSLYDQYEKDNVALIERAVAQLQEAVNESGKKARGEATIAGRDGASNESPPPAAAEAARKDEAGHKDQKPGKAQEEDS